MTGAGGALGSRPRLVLLEDDQRLGALVSRVLDDEYHVVWSGSIADAERLVSESEPDVLVVDRRLPDGDGLDFVRWLREGSSAVPVLLLSALGDVREKVTGLDAGANDYLAKPFDFDELLARLRALTRVYGVDSQYIDIGEWRFFPSMRAIQSPYAGRVMLSAKEGELLELLASRRDSILSREQIVDAIFRSEGQLGTVDTYVHYIRAKTERALITTVRGRGYRIGAP